MNISPEKAAELLNENPEIRSILIEKLMSQRDAIDENLKSLGHGAVRTRAPNGSGKSAPETVDGRSHVDAVLFVLGKLPKGGSSGQIQALLAEQGHPMNAGTVHSTINALTKANRVAKRPLAEGKRGQMYTIPDAPAEATNGRVKKPNKTK